MSGNSLLDRLPQLPLILAGPIVRRVESHRVTVWVALQRPSLVTLKVYSTQDGAGLVIDRQIFQGSQQTISLGKYLYLVAVTAKPIQSEGLDAEKIYAYDLDFGSAEGSLISPSVNPHPISYFDHKLPTFATTPINPNHLRIVHGSCRKPHGSGRDALSMLDLLIEENAYQPSLRPQQLFLTGDQIYGDDVANPLLYLATEIGDTLLGWVEQLPFQRSSDSETIYKEARNLLPGQRSDLVRDYGGFTAMLPNQPDKAKSHLLSFGEYVAMYLLVWSPILWPQEFPQIPDRLLSAMGDAKDKAAKIWQEEVFALGNFCTHLPRVRRVLANVPTYMIFDDHDVSDDCYLNQQWCLRVFGKPLGRRVVQNAVLAYAICQGWGNTPEQFELGKIGNKLLDATVKWSQSQGSDESDWQAIAHYLSMPKIDPKTGLPLFRSDGDVFILDSDALDEGNYLSWNYHLVDRCFEVLVLDTRTWRGYPLIDEANSQEVNQVENLDDVSDRLPILLSPTAFDTQIRQCLARTQNSGIPITIIVLPTNIESLWLIDVIQQWHLSKGRVFESDVGDAWNLNKKGFSQLLATLFEQRDRIVVFSGDIHYSSAVRINYWAKTSDNIQSSKILAQLTSSALKNAEQKTYIINTKVKALAPELPQDWAGWYGIPKLVEIQTIQERVKVVDVPILEEPPVIKQIRSHWSNGNIAWEITVSDREQFPDWRYRIEWMRRQPAKESVRQKSDLLVKEMQTADHKRWKNLQKLVSWLWRNRWLQDGEEAIGYSNFSLVSFIWSEATDGDKIVVQDVYWRSPWQHKYIVYSRYYVSLKLDNPPPQIREISQFKLP
ncbi:PhoD-like phosphatase [Merismopedia glauca]|uniref:PhoD-like phosphatase n=1 Tax=Merismopedia glauca CCAP 1448/3 TaxID=1296344 RepID=A0A2T1C1C4_9CYAN|nr:PhoD-like phosphatase [Merismopedia glauca]PSB02042.1 PhoD-like phosphatase [Merismopedia glauca CCAP 1448/3]